MSEPGDPAPDPRQPTEHKPHTEWPYQHQPEKTLPFSGWWAVVAGACLGVMLRVGVFDGSAGNAFSPMMGSFIYLAPLLVGAVTVFIAERLAPRSWGYYVASSALASFLFIVGTLMVMVEGLICAVLIVPVFALSGMAGGLIMGAACRLTRLAKQMLCTLALLPLVLGSAETHLATPDHLGVVERTLEIAAPPAAIWQHIHNMRISDSRGMPGAWVFSLGVPEPRTGISRPTAQGHVRRVTLQQGAWFEQEFIEWQPDRYARWRFRFMPESFPPGTLDEHVVIGGHYFDLQEGELQLEPRGPVTAVTVRIRYRVSTQFNWYAAPLARMLMGNLEESLLEGYRQAVPSRPAPAPLTNHPRATL